ncbi:MAG TPA: acyl-CoA dehydrogenase [Hellea balneolensis]|uniref:Acyl-CoA dehydrogenase n=1 Tax=Hellea balneolensis TaxID=287478 RepID=A0A7C5QXI6_9PROT|nr:acyl-CoA dehydrogenase [Hellea balneolensis]
MSDQDTWSEADERMMFETIDRWCVQDVRPKVMEMEHADEYPVEFVETMKEFGLFGATISQKYGGLGLSALFYSRIVTRISEEWMSLTGIFNSHLMMATVVEKYGTDEQKDYWLPKFCSGEIRGALGLTEPNAGTDLQAIRTVATKDGDEYVFNGSKTWISNGINGQAVALMVKTDPDADPRYRGMSMFITPKFDPDTGKKYAGFTTGNKMDKLGYKGIDSAELFFDNYRIDARRHLIGGKEGQGFFMAVGGLELGRINVAARSVGIANRALAEATRYAQERETFGKPICEHQAIQLKIGEMATRAKAAKLLTEDAAKIYDAGERCDMEAGMAKYFASEAAVKNAMEAMRIHGGYSYSKEYPVERLYREAPLMCIGEGTNEMQRIIIAKQHIKRNKI